MRIILMGKQAFGRSTLEKFHGETDHDVVAVYCEPDKDGAPIDPVKEYAQSCNIPLFQPPSFKGQKVLDQIKSHDADLCVMAYITIFIPDTVRNIPKHGSICFHPSLLPMYRGPSSINWTIISGANKTGLTIFYPNDRLDGGDILLQKKIEIGPNETLGDVYFSKIFPLGVDACIEATNLIAGDNAPRIIQDETKATYDSWCKKDNAKIDWKKTGREIYNLIRGCNPQPGAWAKFKGNEFTFFDTNFENDKNMEYFPGQICSVNKNDIGIAVKGGILKVSRFKSGQGKLYVKDMNTVVFSEGNLFS